MSKLKETIPISNSRRRLVKSSAAAMPAILTLRSGAAFAQGSSADVCIERDQQRAGDEKPKWATTPESLDHRDPWARVESEYVLVKEAKIEKIIVVNVNQERVVTIGKPFKVALTNGGWKNIYPFADSEQYHTFIPETRADSGEDVIVMTSESLGLERLFKVVEGNPFNEGYNQPISVLVQVNGEGIVVGFGPSKEDNHVTGSCWASVNALGVA